MLLDYKVQVLLLFSTVCARSSDSYWIVPCLCMSSNWLPCLSAYVMVFITSQRTTVCVVGGVLVLLLSSMSRFFKNLPLILFSAPCLAWREFICQHSKTVSSEDTHNFAAEYESKHEQPGVKPHTVSGADRHTVVTNPVIVQPSEGCKNHNLCS